MGGIGQTGLNSQRDHALARRSPTLRRNQPTRPCACGAARTNRSVHTPQRFCSGSRALTLPRLPLTNSASALSTNRETSCGIRAEQSRFPPGTSRAAIATLPCWTAERPAGASAGSARRYQTVLVTCGTSRSPSKLAPAQIALARTFHIADYCAVKRNLAPQVEVLNV